MATAPAQEGVGGEVPSPDALEAADREALHDLILILADSKRLLGLRYADWTLGAPELEAGIACASMAQDEWGHARQLYALLRDFGDDTDALEHGREAGEYRSIAILDQPPAGWPELVALNALVDTALTVQFEALTGSSYTPLRQRCEKLLDEERFHLAHGSAWFRRLAGAGEAARKATAQAAAAALNAALLWFGPASQRAGSMVSKGLAGEGPDAMRNRYLERVGGLLELVGVGADTKELDFSNFREEARRPAGATPDPTAIAQVRGDRNRAFLMD